MPHECPTNDERVRQNPKSSFRHWWGIGGAFVISKTEKIMLPFDPRAAGPVDPFAQRGSYARQRFLTLADLLLEQRIIFLSTVIVNEVASAVIKQLLFLQYENKTSDIHLYINSPGGSVSATLAIYDTMQILEAPIHTTCMGIAASGAAVLLAA